MNVPSPQDSVYYNNANALYVVSDLNGRHLTEFETISGQVEGGDSDPQRALHNSIWDYPSY